MLVPQFYFYPEYTNTLELLREFGCTPRTEILSEDVSSLMLSLSPESIENGKYSGIISELSDSASTAEYGDSSEEITVTDKADIALVLDHTERCSDGILDAGSSSSDYLYIQYPNGDSAAYSVQYPISKRRLRRILSPIAHRRMSGRKQIFGRIEIARPYSNMTDRPSGLSVICAS